MTARPRWAAAGVAMALAAACDAGGGGAAPPTTAPATMTTAADRSVRFGVWGDTPYGPAEAALVPSLVQAMNGAGLAFSVNVGDVKSGGAPCDDAVYTEAAATFDRFEAPLVYVPGDNEWSDCHRGGHDPLERLDHLRRVLAGGEASFGRRPLALVRQRPGYPEHSRWQVGDVTGIGLNVPGGNNNHVADPAAPEPTTTRTAAQRAAAEAEFRARDEAAAAWLRAGFEAAAAGGARAVAVFLQADPRFDVPAGRRAGSRVDGYDRLLATLAEQAGRFAGPVLVVHGDTHQFRSDRPLVDPATGAAVPNVHRVETYGSPLVGWVEVTVDPAAAEPVRAEPHVVFAPFGPP